MSITLRRIALVLALVMVIPMLFVGCGGKEGPKKDEDGWSLGDSGKAATPDNLPEDLDYQGYKFKILYRAGEWCDYLECNGNIGDDTVNPIHRSVYERNRHVESRLNCEIKFIPTTTGALAEGAKEVENILEAEEYYDFFVLTNNLIVTRAKNHQLCDFNDAEYVDYTQPWWWMDVTDELSFDGQTYNYMVGDMNLINFTKMSAFYFNFQLCDERLRKSPEYFYDLVENNRWTIEEVDRLTKNCYRDLNGDNTANAADSYAFPWTGSEVTAQFVWSTRIADQLYERNSAGLVTLNIHGNRDVFEVAETLRDLLNGNPEILDYRTEPAGTFDGKIITEFASSKYVFLAQRLTAAVQPIMREMEDDYGILPYPVLKEGDDYISFIQSSSSCVCIPLIAEKNIEMSGICIEALCSEAYRYTTDIFFEQSLKAKFTRDETDKERAMSMIDLIYETAHKSFLIEYDGKASSICGSVVSSIEATSFDLQSRLDARTGAESAINTYISETLQLIQGYTK